MHKEREQQEKDRKRKREQDAPADTSLIGGQDPTTGDSPSKRTKVTSGEEIQPQGKNQDRLAISAEEDEQIRQEKAKKRKEQRDRAKDAKRAEKAAKKERVTKVKAKKAEAREAEQTGIIAKDKTSRPERNNKKIQKNDKSSKKTRPIQQLPMEEHSVNEDDDAQADAQIDRESFEDEASLTREPDEDETDDSSSSAASSPEQENLFDQSTNHSSASSSSSVVPPSNPSDTSVNKSQQHHEPSSKSTLTQQTISISNKDSEGPEVFDAKIDLPVDDSSSQHLHIENPSNIDTLTTRETSAMGDGSSTTAGATDSQLPKIDREALTKRLADKLAALRAARKADGPDGKPAKSRAELIEGRRRKAELRKQRQKEQRAKNRVMKDAEEEAARLRGGNGSPIWSPSLYGPGGALANEPEPDFQFGKVAFDDGVEVDVGAGILKDSKKKKGKSDAKTALLAAEKKKARLAGYDADKRAGIEEKDAWAAAKNRVSGEKRKDDPSLLKKTIKRNEKAKGKSEKEWNDRIESVKKGQEMRQQKREDNLRKRREMKGVKGKDRKKLLGKQKGRDGVQKPKQKKRPGFEGTFKTTARRM